MLQTTKEESLTELLLIASAYRQSAMLVSAIELKIFSVLSEKPKNLLEVALALNVSHRSVEKLLGALVGLGLVKNLDSQFHNSVIAEQYLVPGKELYLGDGILFLKQIGEKTWSTLTEAITQGGPVGQQRTAEPDAEFWRNLTRAIRPLSQTVAESICQIFRTCELTAPTVLDLAGGSGVFGQVFLKTFPNAEVVQADWPGVNAVAKQYAESLNVLQRFSTIDGNIQDGLWCNRKYDVIVLSHFLHQETKSSAIELLTRIRGCLKDGGFLVINEFCLNTEKTAPKYGLIFALSMALQNEGGDSYSIPEYMEWMNESEIFPELVYSPTPPSTVIIGRSRGDQKGTETAHFVPIKPRQTSIAMPTNFKSSFWDVGAKLEVEEDLFNRMKLQIQFATRTVDFWKKRLPPELSTMTALTRDAIESIPLLHKSQIRNLSPFDLAPKLGIENPHLQGFSIFRGTGGTTGKPTGVFWTKDDWNAAIEAATRYLDRLKSFHPLIVWNGYNQAHVSGPAFDDIVRMLGGTPIPRHFLSTDSDAIDEIRRVKANVLVVTPQGGSGKGGSLENLLITDMDFIKKFGIRALMVSSTPLSEELVQEVKSQGIEDIFNFYGSTEAFPSAVSCPMDPTVFHLCFGHLFVEVVNEQGHQVKSGENGLIVVSRIGGSSTEGMSPNQGTQLFRYVVGDVATFIEGPCSCGKNTPRIKNIARVQNLEDKIKGGCERWE